MRVTAISTMQESHECVVALTNYWSVSPLLTKNTPACFLPNADSYTALKSPHESPLNKSHSCLSHYHKTTNHNQGTLLSLCRCGQTHAYCMCKHIHTELFPDKGLWLGLVCGLLLCLYWTQWDSVQYTCPTTKHRAALWREAITWLQRSCCNPSSWPSISPSLCLPPSLLCTFTVSPLFLPRFLSTDHRCWRAADNYCSTDSTVYILIYWYLNSISALLQKTDLKTEWLKTQLQFDIANQRATT